MARYAGGSKVVFASARIGTPDLVTFFLIAALTMTTAAGQGATEGSSVISPAQLAKDAAHGRVVVLDVRTPAEYRAGHIPGAINLNIEDQLFRAEASALLQPDATYVVHCTANPGNGRSARATQELRQLGFEKLLNLQGGITAWQGGGFPLDGDSGAAGDR